MWYILLTVNARAHQAAGGPTILGVFSDQAQAQTAIDNSGLVGEHNREEYIIAQVPVGTLLNN
jgi:hypothetical protein